MSLPLILGPQVLINCLHTTVGNSSVTLADGNPALPAAGGEAVEAKSSDNTKDVSAGTGARKFGLIYLDANGAPQIATEWATNGTTAAGLAGVTNAWRYLDFYMADVGTDLENAGDLTLRVNGGGATRGIIKAGRKRAALGQFTVPAGYKFIFFGGRIYRSAFSASIPLRLTVAVEADMNPSTRAWQDGLWTTLANGTGGLQQGWVGLVPPGGFVELDELTTVRARAVTESTSTVEVAGTLRGLLVPKF